METYYSYKKQESLGANKGNVPERTYKYYPDEFYKQKCSKDPKLEIVGAGSIKIIEKNQ